VQARYGIDVNSTGAAERSVSAALARTAQARAESDSERIKAAAARADDGKGDREAVNCRLLADKHQGTPATAAAAQKPSLAGPR
jgi:hypothetical protein